MQIEVPIIKTARSFRIVSMLLQVLVVWLDQRESRNVKVLGFEFTLIYLFIKKVSVAVHYAIISWKGSLNSRT